MTINLAVYSDVCFWHIADVPLALTNVCFHQIVQGLSSVIAGVSALSNAAGDRHGTVQGVTLQDNHLAVLCVNACGSVGLSFIEKHLFMPM